MLSNEKGNLVYLRLYISLKEHIIIMTFALGARFFTLFPKFFVLWTQTSRNLKSIKFGLSKIYRTFIFHDQN